MEQTIEIRSGGGNLSRVMVGDVLDRLPELIGDRRTIVITDSNVHRMHRAVIDRYEHIVTGLGEANKNMRAVERIYSELLAMNADRGCFILGVGGGIVSDLAGFAASTYMRGLPFGFVATTLLAQVDASVGGKNGVNVEGYKNMAGTFNQPEFVLCDTGLLRTLPDREFAAGMAEVVKAAVIADPGLFSLLESHTLTQIREDATLLARIVSAAVKVKADIVGRDEKERGERRKLNLGHTLAHAIEKSDPSVLHGEAVAMGLAAVSRFAARCGELDEASAVRIESVLRSFGLPTEPPAAPKRLLSAMRHDKKRDGNIIYYPIPTAIGECRMLELDVERLDTLLE